MNKLLVTGCLLTLALTLTNCGGKEEEQTEEPKNTMDAIQQMAQKAEEMQNREPVDPVDFRELKELLPSDAAGLERIEATGEKTGAMGFTISQAEAKYQKEDANIEVQILDTGGVGGMAMMGLAAWTMAEVDKETASGYEKTTLLNDHKAFEKYDNNQQDGELNLIVGDRYIVNVKGRNVSMDQLKGTLNELDLDKLAAMK
jgi:hypothetical protein